MRLVDADKVVNRLKTKRPSNDMMRVMLAECIAEINAAPTIKTEYMWRDPATELPPDDEFVLVLVTGGGLESAPALAEFDHDGWTLLGLHCDEWTVEAWLPIPERK